MFTLAAALAIRITKAEGPIGAFLLLALLFDFLVAMACLFCILG